MVSARHILMRISSVALGAALLAPCFGLVGCGGDNPSPSPGPAPNTTPAPAPSQTAPSNPDNSPSSNPAPEPDNTDTGDGTTSGPAYTEPASIEMATFDAAAAQGANDALIDTSNVAKGYVGASAVNASRLKFQVIKGEMAYNYDLPGDGTPIICPINMGDGPYTFRVMQNTSGTNYVEVFSVEADVALESPFAPFLRPNVFCDFTNTSASVELARELAASAQNEGEVVRAVYEWVVRTITYDTAKAAELANGTGYVPSPDATLAATEGICFDYASLAAAMFRSLGIPCQIVTGYVSPDNIYHAWNMIYIDGQWVSVQITVNPDTWTRVDLTFAAAGAGSTIGDGTTYTDRYVY